MVQQLVPKMHVIDYLAKVAENDKRNSTEGLQVIQEAVCNLFAKAQEQPPLQILNKCQGKLQALAKDLQGLVINYAGKDLSEAAREIKHPREAYKRIGTQIHWSQWNSQYLHVEDVSNSSKFKITLQEPWKIPHFCKSIQVSSDCYLACGGRETANSNGLKKAFLIKNNPLSVQDLPDMKSGRANHCLVYFNRFIYVIGGCDHDNRYTNRVERLCLSNYTWEDLSSTNEIRDSTSAVGLERENSIYVFGGRTANATVCRSIEKYMVSVNIWVSVPLKLTYESMVLGSILISPCKVLVFGGQTGLAVSLRNCNVVDLQNLTVTEIAPMPSPGGCIVNEPILVGNKVFAYVFLGADSRVVECWDLDTQDWSCYA